MPLSRRDFLRASAVAGGAAWLGPGLVGRAMAEFGGTADPFATIGRVSRLFPGDERLVVADLHNHSHFSDAAGDPAFFYSRIRAAGIDVAALTDHASVGKQLTDDGCGPQTNQDGEEDSCQSLVGIDEADWDRNELLANAADSPGAFVALRGFEWSSPTVGHSNAWFTTDWIDPLSTGGVDGSSTLQAIADNNPLTGLNDGIRTAAEQLVAAQAGASGITLYHRWLNNAPGTTLPGTPFTSGGSDGVFGYNHPGREAGRFNVFEFEQSLQQRMVSIEMFNKGEDYLFEGFSLGRTSPLVECLDAGWKPAIIGTSDEHGTDWGSPLGKGKAGLWAPALTRAGVRSALESRRVFATREKGLRIDAAANGQKMGSTFGHRNGSSMLFELDIEQATTDIALVDGTRSRPAIGVPGKRLVLQVLQSGAATGDRAPRIVSQQEVTVPRPDQPWISVRVDGVQLRTDGGPSWVLLRLSDPDRAADGDSTQPKAFKDAGLSVVYTSPWYLSSSLPEPTVRQAPGNAPVASPSLSASASATPTATLVPTTTPTTAPSPTSSPTTSPASSPTASPSRSATPAPSPSAPPSGPVRTRVTRLAGDNRFETAVEVSRAGFAAGVTAAYVATGQGFPDGLAAVPAAARDSAPVLLTSRDVLPAPTAAELRRLRPGRIYVLGGPAVVSEAVRAELARIAPVERLAGQDRYETAVAVSRSRFAGGAVEVGIVTGESFIDALAAGPSMARVDGPLLLVTRDVVPAVVDDELRRLAPQRVTVFGGSNVVSDEVLRQVGARSRDGAQRIAGATRFATAAAVAEQRFPEAADVLVATGFDYPDALGAGALAAQRRAPLLLVRQDGVPPETDEQLERFGPERIAIAGGPRVVSEEVERQLGTYQVR